MIYKSEFLLVIIEFMKDKNNFIVQINLKLEFYLTFFWVHLCNIYWHYKYIHCLIAIQNHQLNPEPFICVLLRYFKFDLSSLFFIDSTVIIYSFVYQIY